LWVAQRDQAYRAALAASDLVVADGVGAVWASRLLGGRLVERVPGPDVFERLLAFMSRRGGHRLFLLGSSPDVLAAMADRLARDYPGVALVGTFAPPFRAEFSPAENDEMVSRINAAGADVLAVGMTAPKQEKWAWAQRQHLHVRLVLCVGAAFDFLAGTRPRAPAWLQAAGLEWAYRLWTEPRRLWRRYLLDGPRFLWAVMRARQTRSR
jgi:N-acetylglucosaminyldiphosphoundecaprenol N-acetyl-beta-D-mannosaminyltransferase